MSATNPSDKSNGYDDFAKVFIERRNTRIGPSTVLNWSQSLAPGSSILEIGCGNGVISQALVDAGFILYGIDASPKMICAFQERLPAVPVECAAVEDSTLFNRTFDGIVAWGLMFLLPFETQVVVITKVANALKPGGQFLFTSPRDAISWKDAITQRESCSLGTEVYRELLEAQGLALGETRSDEGDNHYYIASKG
jgi:2-polyprenyl-3-methyl-5-hydroxy-6-metoxy-1,4-benzoquinol methylase